MRWATATAFFRAGDVGLSRAAASSSRQPALQDRDGRHSLGNVRFESPTSSASHDALRIIVSGQSHKIM